MKIRFLSPWNNQMEYNPAELPDIDAVEVLDLKNGLYQFKVPTDPPAKIRVVRVTGREAQEVAHLWQLLPPGQQARCHTPPFGFRFYDQEHLILEASVCWQCDNIYIENEGQRLLYEFDAQARVAQELLALARRIMGEEPLPTLEDWIRALLGHSVEELNEAYRFKWGEDAASREIEKVLGVPKLPDDYKAHHGTVRAEMIEELHRKIRGQKCEAAIWSRLLFYLGELPPAVAHDLIDRDKMVNTLGHTRQCDEVRWRLAGLVPEALRTFVFDMFTQPRYSTRELELLLGQHKGKLDLLDMWEHVALLSLEAHDHDKEVVFHHWAWEHRQFALERRHPLVIPSPEQYLELMADKQRQALEEREQLEREAEAKRLRLEREAEVKRAELGRIEGTALTEVEIERILNEKDPESLLALAGNRKIEKKWIERLLNCYGVKGARAIREAAVRNWEKPHGEDDTIEG